MTEQKKIDDSTLIHRINYEGFPFQRAVADTIKWAKGRHGSSLGFKVDEECPIGISNHPDPTKSNTIDISAVQINKTNALYLTIECKRPDLERKIWVFMNHHELGKLRQTSNIHTWYLDSPTEGYVEKKFGSSNIRFSDNFFHASYPMEIVHVNPKESEKKPPQRNVVMGACLQASIGTIGILDDVQIALENGPRLGLSKYAFLPVVITTADVYSCKCKIADETLVNGDIFEADLNVEKWILYYFPLPQFLFRKTENPQDYEDYYVNRLPVLIVNSMYLNEFLMEVSIK